MPYAQTQLADAKVERIDFPFPHIVSLSVRLKSGVKGVLLLCSDRRLPALGWVTQRPKGRSANAFAQLLRKVSARGRIETIDAQNRIAYVGIQRAMSTSEIWVTQSEARFILIEDLRFRGSEPSAGTKTRPSLVTNEGVSLSWEILEQQGTTIVEESQAHDVEAQKRALRKGLTRRAKKLERKRSAIMGDIERATHAASLRHRGQLLLANLHRIDKDAKIAHVEDWSTHPPQTTEIMIDNTRTPQEQVDHLFRKAKKLERGSQIARERLNETEAELKHLEALILKVDESSDDQTLSALEESARQLGIQPVSAPKEHRKPKQRKPFRTFRTQNGHKILVGRSAADNDQLTLHHATPHDHWLHVRGAAGSHVVVKLAKHQTCTDETLLDAATLAAHFSKLAKESLLEVIHTPRKFVRKRRGSAAGAVEVMREKVVLVRREEARIARLLASEISDPSGG